MHPHSSPSFSTFFPSPPPSPLLSPSPLSHPPSFPLPLFLLSHYFPSLLLPPSHPSPTLPSLRVAHTSYIVWKAGPPMRWSYLGMTCCTSTVRWSSSERWRAEPGNSTKKRRFEDSCIFISDRSASPSCDCHMTCTHDHRQSH